MATDQKSEPPEMKGQSMNMTTCNPQLSTSSIQEKVDSIQQNIVAITDDLIASLPDPKQLSAEDRRGVISRYTTVLEGNFIYWMTATYLAVRSEEAYPILLDNLREEVRDCHPGMMRRFAVAANAYPTDQDAMAVHRELTNVRLFMGQLCGVRSLATMAFFEGFIQRFMAYLAKLAIAQGSAELEYTDVHGVCDVAHTAGLYRALSIEMAINPPEADVDLLEGVHLLRTLVDTIVRGAQMDDAVAA